MGIYNTENFRLAASLVAHGHILIGLMKKGNFNSNLYIFRDSKDLKELLKLIEEGKDSISSLDLYSANDFLTRRISAEAYRKYLENEIGSNEK